MEISDLECSHVFSVYSMSPSLIEFFNLKTKAES